MSVARTPDALVLNVESCNQLVGCPGCGVIAQGHGRVVVEVIDAPWAGSLCGSGGTIRRWMAEGARLLINDPARFEGVRVIGACQFFCVWGLEVGGDSVGVGGGELGEGLFPVGGGVSLDEAGVSCSFVGGFASVCEALGGAFVFDVADGEP